VGTAPDAIANLPEREVRTGPMPTRTRGERRRWVVSKAGFCSPVLTHLRPDAANLWIRRVVLPQMCQLVDDAYPADRARRDSAA
jgi:hypothetical protein